jgi:hypothetical protein
MTIVPSGAFFFLLTYLLAPVLICESLVGRQYPVTVLLGVWWGPMIISALRDWRNHYFGYESRFSKCWFWIGICVIGLLFVVFPKTFRPL